MEGISSTARGAEYPKANCTFPYTPALLSTTFKAQPPNQCAPVCPRAPLCATSGLETGQDSDPCNLPPSTYPCPRHRGEASGHKQSLQTQLYNYITFYL